MKIYFLLKLPVYWISLFNMQYATEHSRIFISLLKHHRARCMAYIFYSIITIINPALNQSTFVLRKYMQNEPKTLFKKDNWIAKQKKGEINWVLLVCTLDIAYCYKLAFWNFKLWRTKVFLWSNLPVGYRPKNNEVINIWSIIFNVVYYLIFKLTCNRILS